MSILRSYSGGPTFGCEVPTVTGVPGLSGVGYHSSDCCDDYPILGGDNSDAISLGKLCHNTCLLARGIRDLILLSKINFDKNSTSVLVDFICSIRSRFDFSLIRY